MLCDVCDHYAVHLKHSAICHISVKLEEEKISKQTHFLKSKRTSLLVQWLRPLTSNAEGMGLIPDWRTKIPQAMQHSKKKKKKNAYTFQLSKYTSKNLHHKFLFPILWQNWKWNIIQCSKMCDDWEHPLCPLQRTKSHCKICNSFQKN